MLYHTLTYTNQHQQPVAVGKEFETSRASPSDPQAAREQLGTDSFALQLQAAPDVNDVLYVAWSSGGMG